MKHTLAFTVSAAILASAVSAHAVQVGANIGLVIKPSGPVTAVIRPTQATTGSIQATGVSGPKVKPMTSTQSTAPAKSGR